MTKIMYIDRDSDRRGIGKMFENGQNLYGKAKFGRYFYSDYLG